MDQMLLTGRSHHWHRVPLTPHFHLYSQREEGCLSRDHIRRTISDQQVIIDDDQMRYEKPDGWRMKLIWHGLVSKMGGIRQFDEKISPSNSHLVTGVTGQDSQGWVGSFS
jgi:hypothetical protein